MKFYDCTTAPSPRRVRIFAAEKGIELDTVQVDLQAGEQFGDAFRALNPDCTVPVLALDDGTCLTEVMGICRYLEALQPDPPLFGASAIEQGLVQDWNSKVEQQGLLAMAEAFRNSVPGLKSRAVTGPVEYEQIPALAERGRQRVLGFLGKLDERLGHSEFVAGPGYSVADITALVFVDFAKRGRITPAAAAPNLERWYSEVAGRPSAAA